MDNKQIAAAVDEFVSLYQQLGIEDYPQRNRRCGYDPQLWFC
jgi:hypothetical protein